jgi:CBS domain-containing protein
MTRNLEEIPPDATLKDAAQKMKSMDFGALPVCQSGQVLGILTDRDITIRAVADGCDPTQTHVRDAMTTNVVFCYDDEDVQQATELMEQKQIRRLLVLDHDKHPVGIVSLGDIATRVRDERLSGEVLEQISEPAQPHA